MSTQHHTRVLERFGQQATALDGEAVKTETSASQLRQIIATGQQQRGQVAAAIADFERQIAQLERQKREQQTRLDAIDEDLAAKSGALADLDRDAVDYRAEAKAVREIVAREVVVLEQQAAPVAGVTRLDRVPAEQDGARS